MEPRNSAMATAIRGKAGRLQAVKGSKSIQAEEV
jgi:hypothetical protein